MVQALGYQRWGWGWVGVGGGGRGRGQVCRLGLGCEVAGRGGGGEESVQNESRGVGRLGHQARHGGAWSERPG